MVLRKVQYLQFWKFVGILAEAMNVMYLFLEVTDVFKFKCVVYSTVFFLIWGMLTASQFIIFIIFPNLVSKRKD
jgi:hypothetical protein